MSTDFEIYSEVVCDVSDYSACCQCGFDRVCTGSGGGGSCQCGFDRACAGGGN